MKHHIKKTAHITKKIIHIKLTIAVLIILPFVVFTLITANTNLWPNLKSFVVVSGSMEPTIPVGSITYTQKVAEYNPEDVIAFKNTQGQTVTHRIADEKSDANGKRYITKGDANKANDAEAVTPDNVLGKVFFHVPYIGYAVNFLKTPLGFILGIIIPTIIFVLFELWNVKNEFVKMAEKRLLEKLQTHE